MNALYWIPDILTDSYVVESHADGSWDSLAINCFTLLTFRGSNSWHISTSVASTKSLSL